MLIYKIVDILICFVSPSVTKGNAQYVTTLARVDRYKVRVVRSSHKQWTVVIKIILSLIVGSLWQVWQHCQPKSRNSGLLWPSCLRVFPTADLLITAISWSWSVFRLLNQLLYICPSCMPHNITLNNEQIRKHIIVYSVITITNSNIWLQSHNVDDEY